MNTTKFLRIKENVSVNSDLVEFAHYDYDERLLPVVTIWLSNRKDDDDCIESELSQGDTIELARALNCY